MTPDTVQQGETYPFTLGVSAGDELDCVISVMQYPGDTPAVSRSVTVDSAGEFAAYLTSAETASLSVGQWFIHARMTDADEDVREPIKIYIAKGWV